MVGNRSNKATDTARLLSDSYPTHKKDEGFNAQTTLSHAAQTLHASRAVPH